MIRQKPESYDPDKDSPLIGGHGARENINFAAEPEVGWGPYVRTAELITLLEQAAKEFPSHGHVNFDTKTINLISEDGRKVKLRTLNYYRQEQVDAWKRKWLMVPPV